MKINKIILAATVAISLSNLYAQHEGCSHGDAPETSPAIGSAKFVQIPHDCEKDFGVAVVKTKLKDFETVVTAIGRVENIPENTVEISSRISGRAVEVYVRADQKIKKGDKICKIESLLSGNPPPSIEIESPTNGIVESLSILKGSPVAQNSGIAKISDTAKMYAVANVFENAAARLKIGQTARIFIEGANARVVGKIVKFGSAINQATNTLPVFFEIDNTNGKIKNGMRAIFNIGVDRAMNVAAVPLSALSGDFGNRFVFVRTDPKENIFERRSVHVGRTNDIEAEIMHGVKEGEEVASSGVYQLQFLPPPAPHVHNSAEENDAHSAHEHSEHAEADEPDDHQHEHSETANTSDSQNKDYQFYLIRSLLGASILLNIVFAIAALKSKRGKTN